MKIRIVEAKLPQPQRKQLIREFIKFCISELGLKSPLNCKITLTNDKSKTTSYAYFNPSNNNIVVYIGNRNVGDIMRSLSHEIYHFFQNQKNQLKPNSGSTGSKEENSANAMSGIIMRKFGKLHPEIFE